MNATRNRFSPRQPARTTDGQRARARALLLLSFSVLLTGACRVGGDGATEPEGWVEIKGKRVAVEVADTPREQQLGLGERDGLAWGHGMYFEYERPAFYGFWMKGMRFSIDIIWLRKGRIVDMHQSVPFEEGKNGPTMRPSSLVDSVLEVPAGYAAANGWAIGDRVRFDRVRMDDQAKNHPKEVTAN